METLHLSGTVDHAIVRGGVAALRITGSADFVGGPAPGRVIVERVGRVIVDGAIMRGDRGQPFLLQLTDVGKVELYDARISGADWAGCQVKSARDVVARGCEMFDNGTAGLFVTSARNVRVVGGDYHGNHSDDREDGYGVVSHAERVTYSRVKAHGNRSAQLCFYHQCGWTTAEDCMVWFAGSEQSGLASGISFAGAGRHVVARGNTVAGCDDKDGPGVDGRAAIAARFHPRFDRANIETMNIGHNTISGFRGSYGIEIGPRRTRTVIVHDNVFEGGDTRGGAIKIARHATGVAPDYLAVHGNEWIEHDGPRVVNDFVAA